MKKLILIIVAVAGCTVTFGQFKLGVRAGVSSASYKADDFTQGGNYIIQKASTADFGFHLGLIGQVGLGPIVLQPELLLSTIGNKYKITDATNQAVSVTKNDRSYNIDFPLIVGYKISILKLEAGPTGRFLLGKTSQLKDYTGYETKFNSATWAFQTGVGVDLLGITADLKYEFPLSKYGDGITVGGVDRKFDSRVRQFILSVGIFF
jgi:hypothetical protein